MADSNTRQAKRTPVSLKIKFKSATLAQFIERYSVDVSHGGIFIRTKDPLPVGTTMRFEFQLRDASPLITGEGTVVWTREHDPSRTGVAPGMGVRFDRLTEGSQEVLDQILSQKGGSKPADRADSRGFTDTPTRVAPSPLLDGLAKGSKLDGMGGFDDDRSDTTPLPSPVPFHSDVDEFPEETFEEATKVRSLDELVAASATGDFAAIQSAMNRSAQGSDEGSDEAGAEASAQAQDEAQGEGPHSAAAEQAEESEADDEPRERAPTTPFGSTGSGSFDITLDEDDEPTAKAKVPEAPEPAPGKATAATATATAATATAATAADEPPARAEAVKQEPARDRTTGKRTAVAVERDDDSTESVEPPRRARETSEGNSGLALALVAVLILVLGAGGYFLFTRGKAKNQAANTEQVDEIEVEQPTETEQAAVEPEPPPEKPPEPPPVTLVEVEVRSEPSGATATLVGTDQSGPTPMKFQVDESKSHTVRIAQPGFVAQEITVDPKQPAPEPVVLAVAPMIIRVSSEPGGAYVYVDGRRVDGETPNEFTLPDNWRKKKRFKVAVRRSGYEKLDVMVESDQFKDEGNAMVVTVDQPMVEKQKATSSGSNGSSSSGSSGSSGGSGSGGTDGTKATGSDGAQGSGSGSGDGATKDTGSGASKDTGKDTGSGAGKDTGSGAGKDTGSGSGQGSGDDTGKDTGKDTSKDTGSGAGQGTGSGTTEPTPDWAK